LARIVRLSVELKTCAFGLWLRELLEDTHARVSLPEDVMASVITWNALGAQSSFIGTFKAIYIAELTGFLI
jgi:hypothetical protein